MRTSRQTLVGFAIVFAVSSAMANESGVKSKSKVAARMDSAARYSVDFRVAITPRKGTRQLRVWVPIPSNDAIQQPSRSRFETFPRDVEPTIHTENQFGNRFAYFEFSQPTGAVMISHQFEVTTSRVNWNVDPANVIEDDPSDPSLAPYRIADPREAKAAGLQQIVAQFDRRRAGNVNGLLSAMNWVDQNMKYDHSVASLSGDPSHALKNRTGHCSDYHGICSAMARRVGYPSRIAYGMQMFDKGSPSHCKLEVHLPPYGWVPFDLSETQKKIKKLNLDDGAGEIEAQKVRERTQRGFRENTWIKMTQGVHYELAPKASRRVSLVRTIYAEADGEPLPEPDPSDATKTTFSWMTMHRVDPIQGQPERF